MYRQAIILFFACTAFFCGDAFCQRTQFSIATDLGLQRNFKKEQRYWAGGHTLHAHFHFTPKDGFYAWIAYYSNGKFTNKLVATAKSPATLPPEVNYTNTSLMRFKQLSVGWKKYLKGAYNSEDSWNLYGLAGFGLVLGRVENTHSLFIDSNDYNIPVRPGKANFKRLTLDVGLGWEKLLGGTTYVYLETRAWIPTSGYPSKHIFANNNAPFVGTFNLGVRILFD